MFLIATLEKDILEPERKHVMLESTMQLETESAAPCTTRLVPSEEYIIGVEFLDKLQLLDTRNDGTVMSCWAKVKFCA